MFFRKLSCSSWQCSSISGRRAHKLFFASLALRRSPEATTFQHEHNLDTRAVENNDAESKMSTAKISRLAWKGQWPEAKRLFDALDGKNTIVYNCMISAADKCKKYEEGLQLFYDMASNTVQRTGVSYASALTILGRQGRASEALQLWKEMHASRVAGTPACLTGLLNAYATTGDISGTKDCLTHAKVDGWSINIHHVGVLLKACRQAGDIEHSINVMQDIRDQGWQLESVHYALAMGTCARAVELGSLDQQEVKSCIQDLKKRMSADGVTPNAFIFEEEVRALAGGTPLQYVCWSKVHAQVIADVYSACEEAEKSGVRTTRLLQKVKAQLSQLLLAGKNNEKLNHSDLAKITAAPVLPAGWHCTPDPSSGNLYYWHEGDPQRTVTWQRPA